MFRYKLRKDGEREWHEVAAETADQAAALFAEERGMNIGEYVQVFRRGYYQVAIEETYRAERAQL